MLNLYPKIINGRTFPKNMVLSTYSIIKSSALLRSFRLISVKNVWCPIPKKIVKVFSFCSTQHEDLDLKNWSGLKRGMSIPSRGHAHIKITPYDHEGLWERLSFLKNLCDKPNLSQIETIYIIHSERCVHVTTALENEPPMRIQKGGFECLIRIATPTFPEGSEATKAAGNCLNANLEVPPAWKWVSWTMITSAFEDLNSFRANHRLWMRFKPFSLHENTLKAIMYHWNK